MLLSHRCIQLVFEKAVDEPGFSSAYARMCQELAKNEVPSSDDPNKKASFRKLLITRCQKVCLLIFIVYTKLFTLTAVLFTFDQEFERDYMEGIDPKEYEKNIKEAKDEVC